METRYLIKQKSGVKISELKALRNALLPLINSGSTAKEDLVLSVWGKNTEVRMRFMTPKQYEKYIKAQEE